MELRDKNRMAIDRIKDYILKLAKEKGSIYYSDYSPEDAKIWQCLVQEVKKDGYIECTFLTVAIWLDISGKGELFMLQGGYSAMRNEEAKMKASEFLETVITEVAKQGVSVLFNRLE